MKKLIEQIKEATAKAEMTVREAQNYIGGNKLRASAMETHRLITIALAEAERIAATPAPEPPINTPPAT